MNEFTRELTALVWAMEPRALHALISKLAVVDQPRFDAVARALAEKGPLLERLADQHGTIALNRQRSAAAVDDLDVRDGVAHITIAGPMMKQVPCMFDILGIPATSTEAARQQLAAAVEDDRVQSIQLDIDSPGGTVDGTAALAEDVRAVRGLKPITACVPDLMASAAMWIGSQAEHIEIGPSASVGSIGVYSVVDDLSRAFENKGVKTHVVSSHELKGAFVQGSHVTDAQLADMQRNIDTYTGLFVEAVAAGRGMTVEAVAVLATGQMWIGTEAVGLGLADSISTGNHVTGIRSEAVATETPLVGQAKEREMDPKSTPAATQAAENSEAIQRLQELEAKAAEREAELAAKDAVIQQMKAQQLDALMAKYEDRIAPSAVESMRAWGESVGDLEAFEKHLQSFPVITRGERQSEIIEKQDGRESFEAAMAERELAKFIGVDVQKHRKLATLGEKVAYVKADQTAVLYDGREIPSEELYQVLGIN